MIEKSSSTRDQPKILSHMNGSLDNIWIYLKLKLYQLQLTSELIGVILIFEKSQLCSNCLLLICPRSSRSASGSAYTVLALSAGVQYGCFPIMLPFGVLICFLSVPVFNSFLPYLLSLSGTEPRSVISRGLQGSLGPCRLTGRMPWMVLFQTEPYAYQ